MQMPIIDTPARWAAAIAVVVAAGVALVLLILTIAGSGPLAGDDPVTAEESVSATVEEFLGAIAGGDYAAACELMTEGVREEVRAGFEGAECAEGLEIVAAAASGTPDVQITDVRISGNQAAVEAIITVAGESEDRYLELLEDGGQWQISSFG
jgi:hypothetical protein